MNRIQKVLAASLVIVLSGFVADAYAQCAISKALTGSCASCGGKGKKCKKICRLECDVREVAIVCWKCETEDFCVGPPCKPGCKECGVACTGCGDKAGKGVQKGCQKDGHKCAKGKKYTIKHEKPGCGPKQLTRKKLYRKVCIKRVPHYRWVIEDVCKGCGKGGPIVVPEGTIVPGTEDEVPPPPAVDASFNYGDAADNTPVRIDLGQKEESKLRFPSRLVNFLTK